MAALEFASLRMRRLKDFFVDSGGATKAREKKRFYEEETTAKIAYIKERLAESDTATDTLLLFIVLVEELKLENYLLTTNRLSNELTQEDEQSEKSMSEKRAAHIIDGLWQLTKEFIETERIPMLSPDSRKKIASSMSQLSRAKPKIEKLAGSVSVSSASSSSLLTPVTPELLQRLQMVLELVDRAQEEILSALRASNFPRYAQVRFMLLFLLPCVSGSCRLRFLLVMMFLLRCVNRHAAIGLCSTRS